tara:strand:+ start:58 stop:252 length:195 start_codon:yes stop_codon:yes gene_type:complete
MSKKPLLPQKYVHGPFATVGRVVTCEVCGHQHAHHTCVVCETAAENGDWVDKVIEEEEQKKNDT